MLTTKVGPDGRVLIPVDVRRAAGLKSGEILVARADGDLVVLEPRAAVVRRLRSRFAAVADDISLVDDLIADRRREAERDLA
jgi:AbrB family looped-hinge helix DNA binding protein